MQDIEKNDLIRHHIIKKKKQLTVHPLRIYDFAKSNTASHWQVSLISGT